VAVQLQQREDVQIALVKGGLGEFSVSIDGRKCIESTRFLYPRPSQIVEKLRAILAQ
jgi:hypothetical protein